MVDWPYKLHYGITFNFYRLYDLSTDPTEQTDIRAEHPEVFRRLRARLRRWMSEEITPQAPRR